MQQVCVAVTYNTDVRGEGGMRRRGAAAVIMSKDKRGLGSEAACNRPQAAQEASLLPRRAYIRAGLGEVGWGELTGRERRAGGKASWGWAAEGAAQWKQCCKRVPLYTVKP